MLSAEFVLEPRAPFLTTS